MIFLPASDFRIEQSIAALLQLLLDLRFPIGSGFRNGPNDERVFADFDFHVTSQARLVDQRLGDADSL